MDGGFIRKSMKKYNLELQESGKRIKAEIKRLGSDCTYSFIVNELEKRGVAVSVSALKQAVNGKQPLGGSKDDIAYRKLASLFGVRTDYIKGLDSTRTDKEFEELTEEGMTAFINYLDSIGYEVPARRVSRLHPFYLPEYMPYFECFTEYSKLIMRTWYPEDMTDKEFYKTYFDWDWYLNQNFKSIVEESVEAIRFYKGKKRISPMLEINWDVIPSRAVSKTKKHRIKIDYVFYLQRKSGGNVVEVPARKFFYLKKILGDFSRVIFNEEIDGVDRPYTPERYCSTILQDGDMDDFDYLKSIYESLIKKGGGKN